MDRSEPQWFYLFLNHITVVNTVVDVCNFFSLLFDTNVHTIIVSLGIMWNVEVIYFEPIYKYFNKRDLNSGFFCSFV